MLEALGDAVLVFDHLGSCLDYRGVAPAVFGLPPGDVRGAHISALFQPKLAARLRAIIGGRTVSGAVEFEYSHDLKGKQHHVQARIIELEPGELLVALRDVTAKVRVASLEREIERLRLEIAHSARVDLVGRMSACLVHELTQPLSAILLNAQAAKRYRPGGAFDGHRVRAILDDLDLDAERARELVMHLRSFLKKGELRRDSVRINQLIQQIVRLIGSELRADHIEVALDLAPKLSTLVGDRVQLEQVLLNLILNAIDVVRKRPAGERRIRVCTTRADSDILISVHDSGPGFGGTDPQRLFEPIFSGKPGSMGAGLSICSRIVASHGGRISAERSAEGGVTLRVVLPSDNRAHKLLTPSRNRAQGAASRADFLPKAIEKANRVGGEFLLTQLSVAMSHLDVMRNMADAATRARCVATATTILTFVDRFLPRLSLASAVLETIRSRRDALQARLHSAGVDLSI